MIERFNQLTSREKGLISVLIIIIAGLGLYYLVYKPVQRYTNTSEARLESAYQLWQDVESAAALYTASGTNTALEIDYSETARTVASRNAATLGLQISRMQPSGDHTVEIWMSDADPNQLMRWLVTLKTEAGLSVSRANITASDGSVPSLDVQISLERSVQ